MKRFNLLLLALCAALALSAKTIYLVPGPWNVDGAKFAAHFWTSSNGDDYSDVWLNGSADKYSVTVDDKFDMVIFKRMNSTASDPGSWDKDGGILWNQTGDLSISGDTYTITGWGDTDGSWSDSGGGTTPTPSGNYYLTGDGTWTGGQAWDAKAALMTDGKLTLKNLPAATYSCKITDGTWANSWGYTSVNSSCTNLTITTDEIDNNIIFTLTAASDVTFTFDGTNICISTDTDVPEPTPITLKTFSTPTPANCEDVMFQAFYYDSNENTRTEKQNGKDVTVTNAYGNTKWTTLLANAGEISSYFGMIWLPPSAYSTGGTGYHPKQFCNQNSSFGSETDLRKLIDIFHDNGAKVIADVVLNHHDNHSTWCDFWPEDFGQFKTWQLTASHIVGNDEMYSSDDAKDCLPSKRGNDDEGEQYTAARDLDHTNQYVQNFSKAYLKWLMNVMDYDGFRYDVAKGFGAQHFGDYNSEAKPYFSVGEYFDGDYNTLVNWVNGTGKRSTAFDFAFKYNAVGQAWKDGQSPDYSKLIYNGQPVGLVGAEYRQYSVTFIDNHDTFNRPDNQGSEFLGYNKSMSDANKVNVLQANAFLLSMPGVPCVFYPHYYKYKSEIQAMVRARRTAGVHNMSAVSVSEVSGSKLIATVTGSKGKLMLKLGSDLSTPSGYKVIAQGSGYAMFVESGLTEVVPKAKAQLNVSPLGGKYIDAQKVTLTCTEAGAKIYYTLDGSEPTNQSTAYTAAISVSTNTTIKAIAYLSDGTTTKVQVNEYKFVDPTVPITVKCYNTKGWGTMSIWAWIEQEGKEATNLFAGWPGKTMKNEGDGWWSYTFDVSTQRPICVIFNDGKPSGAAQTQDIKGVMESTCYYIDNVTGMGKESVDCLPPTAVEETEAISINIYPNPARDVINIATDQPISGAWIYNVAGQLVSTEYGTNQVDVRALSAGLYLLRVQTANGAQITNLFVKE